MSSFVFTTPEALAQASGDLSGIADALHGATAAATPSATGIVAAAGDEVSTAIARVFGGYADEFLGLTAQAVQFHARFARAVGEAGAAYATAEAANVPPLVQTVLQKFFDQGIFSPFTYLTGQPLFGKLAVGPAVGSGSLYAGTGTPGAVTAVKEGYAYLEIPVGPHGYDAPTRWFFPTQANGTVDARGVIYLQHGFTGTGGWYSDLAIALARGTDCIVVVPTLSSVPLPMGAYLSGTQMHQAVAGLFMGNETALNLSASQAGFHGTLPQQFVLTGHSSGGSLATLAAGDYVAGLGGNVAANHLLGVVMFDGFAGDGSAFASAITYLKSMGIPDYVVAAPGKLFDALGATTNELVNLYPGQFVGIELANGSHVDSMLGGNPVIDFVAQLITSFSPPGDTEAVYTLSTGWINDFFAGGGPTNPIYGIYGPTGGYLPPGGQHISLGQATGIVLPV